MKFITRRCLESKMAITLYDKSVVAFKWHPELVNHKFLRHTIVTSCRMELAVRGHQHLLCPGQT